MVKVAVPLALPQKAGVVVAETVIASGAVRVVEPETVQPFASVTVTVNVPPKRPVLLAVVRLLLQA
jgi:hypothetical protein